MEVLMSKKVQTKKGNWENRLLKQRKEELTQSFSQYYFQINEKEIKDNISTISHFLQEGKVDLVVPMKEEEGAVENLFHYVMKRLPPYCLLIVNDESRGKALEVVKNFRNTFLINKEEILETLRWEKLLPLLGLSQIPKGKGMAVLAGYLFRHLLKKEGLKKSEWVFQTDADIKNHHRFQPLEYLTWGILKNPKVIHVKIAKSGRNNEAHMAVRSALVMLEDIEKVVSCREGKEIAQRAGQLFERLAKYKWILSGTFAISDNLAYTRPFSSGYLDETLTCAFVEDISSQKEGFSIQISNPNSCLDRENSFLKENMIIQRSANFLITLALAKKSVSDWTADDIGWINNNLMNPIPIVLIPPKGNEEPVIVEVITNERILPSVKMLEENGLIDKVKAMSLLRRFRF